MEKENKTDEKVAEVAPAQTPINTTSQVVEQESQEQINWKKFREARESDRKQRVEAEKKAAEKEAEAGALKAAMDALLNKSQLPTQDHSVSSTQNPVELSEDQRIQMRVDEAFAKREREETNRRAEREKTELPQRIAASLSDFNQVCTTENLDYLEYHYPEVAAGFKYMPEGYDKWASVYKAVKRFVPNTDSKKDTNKAEKNFAKPQAMSIAGKTQVGDTAPQNLDDKRRSDNWARMQKVMRGG